MRLNKFIHLLARNIINCFIPKETLGESKNKWNKLADRHPQNYIWTKSYNISEAEFRESGSADYRQYISDDLVLREYVNMDGNGRVLEIGCGIGRMIEFFKNDFSEIYGLDISKSMIDKAKIRLPDAKFKFIEGDGISISLPSNFIDFIFSFIVFQHMPSKKIIELNLKEAYRVLKPGGIFKLQLRGNIVSKRTWYYGPHFTKHEAIKLIKDVGYNVLAAYYETEKILWFIVNKPNVTECD